MVKQRRLIDESVNENDVLLDAKIAGARRETLAIGLALVAQQFRVRGAQDDINDVGAGTG